MRIKVTENEKVVWEARELVKMFNEYFPNVKSNLDIHRPPNITLCHDPVLHTLKKCENHSTIQVY